MRAESNATAKSHCGNYLAFRQKKEFRYFRTVSRFAAKCGQTSPSACIILRAFFFRILRSRRPDGILCREKFSIFKCREMLMTKNKIKILQMQTNYRRCKILGIAFKSTCNIDRSIEFSFHPIKTIETGNRPFSFSAGMRLPH